MKMIGIWTPAVTNSRCKSRPLNPGKRTSSSRHAGASGRGLRRNSPAAANRGENYHQLRRAISYAGFGKLRFKTEYEQELWAECSRLIANCIILYNASILSRLLEHQERTGDTQGAEATKKVSPNAWQHINLQGRYEFQKQPDPLNMDAIIRELTEMFTHGQAA